MHLFRYSLYLNKNYFFLRINREEHQVTLLHEQCLGEHEGRPAISSLIVLIIMIGSVSWIKSLDVKYTATGPSVIHDTGKKIRAAGGPSSSSAVAEPHHKRFSYGRWHCGKGAILAPGCMRPDIPFAVMHRHTRAVSFGSTGFVPTTGKKLATEPNEMAFIIRQGCPRDRRLCNRLGTRGKLLGQVISWEGLAS